MVGHYFCSCRSQDAICHLLATYSFLSFFFSLGVTRNCDADLLTVQVKQQRLVFLWINTETALK